MSHRLICSMRALALLPSAGMSASVGGVEPPDQMRINGLDQPLVRNGADIRNRFFVSALYLMERQAGVGALPDVPSAKRGSMQCVYQRVSRRQRDQAWRASRHRGPQERHGWGR